MKEVTVRPVGEDRISLFNTKIFLLHIEGEGRGSKSGAHLKKKEKRANRSLFLWFSCVINQETPI